jgi:hypothetical protein
VERRVAGAEQSQAGHVHPQAPQIVVVLDRLRGDVVAEPLGLLVGVRVAADVDEQRGVVDDRSLLLVQPERLREPQRDQALPQDVLHRLAEAEIDAKRQSGDQLGQSNVRPIGFVGHRANLTLVGDRDEPRGV